MEKVIFITGNQAKADYLEIFLGFPIDHVKVDLDELQSLDLKKIVEHKVKQAYAEVGKPVVVEDVSLEFEALGRLPGPFIRFFVDEMPLEDVCSLLDGKSRGATARCVFGFFDGKKLELFEGSLKGEIAKVPEGENGYGFDRIFIPEGYDITRAQMNEDDDKKTYLMVKPIEELKKFLISKK